MDKKEKKKTKFTSISKKAKEPLSMITTKSSKNLNNMILNNLTSKDSTAIETKLSSNKTEIGKFKSTLNISNKIDLRETLLTESSSTKFFPKLPEFYNEKDDYFWQKEMKKMKSEKSIFADKKGLNKDSSKKKNHFFYETQISENNTKKFSHKINMNKTRLVEVDLNQPIPVKKTQAMTHRERDFVNNVNIFDQSISRNNEQIKKRVVSPLHLKQLESSLNKISTSNIYIPFSHPSYKKKDSDSKSYVKPSTRKRLDLLRTKFDFTKSYQ